MHLNGENGCKVILRENLAGNYQIDRIFMFMKLFGPRWLSVLPRAIHIEINPPLVKIQEIFPVTHVLNGENGCKVILRENLAGNYQIDRIFMFMKLFGPRWLSVLPRAIHIEINPPLVKIQEIFPVTHVLNSCLIALQINNVRIKILFQCFCIVIA